MRELLRPCRYGKNALCKMCGKEKRDGQEKPHEKDYPRGKVHKTRKERSGNVHQKGLHSSGGKGEITLPRAL